MKKLLLGLCFFSAVLTASASNEVVILPANKVEFEIQNLELLYHKTNAKAEPDRTYNCTLYANGKWNTGTYSCFFCWGGGENTCIANLARNLNIVL